MVWKEFMKEHGGGDLAFLSEDGEALIFAVVGEPILLEGKFKGRPSTKIGCPIVTSDGFALFVAGKRLARKLSKHEHDFDRVAFIAIRHGEQNDITATYELKLLDDADMTSALLATAKEKDWQVDIDDAVNAAIEVMRQ